MGILSAVRNKSKEETMKSDFTKELYVQVCDREGDKPAYAAFSDLIDSSEDNGAVAVYELVSVKKLRVTRELK